MSYGADKLKMGSILTFKFKLTLNVKVNCRPKIIRTLAKIFCIFGPNLVILAWTGPELSCGQASDWHRLTHGHTHTQMQAMTIPDGQNWPQVKNDCTVCVDISWDVLHVVSEVHSLTPFLPLPLLNNMQYPLILKRVAMGLNCIMLQTYLVILWELWFITGEIILSQPYPIKKRCTLARAGYARARACGKPFTLVWVLVLNAENIS